MGSTITPTTKTTENSIMRKFLLILITLHISLFIQAQTKGQIEDWIEKEKNAANLGDYKEAIRYNEMVKEAYGNQFSQNDETYDMILYRLANYYAMIDSLDKAIKIKLQEIEIIKQLKGDKHPDYATSLFNLADLYFYKGDSPMAISLGTSAVDIYEATIGESSPLYAHSLVNLADFYYSIDNFILSVELCSRGIKLLRTYSSEDEALISNSLGLLSRFLESLFYFAIDMADQNEYNIAAYAMKVVKDNYPKEDETYFYINFSLANFYSAKGDYHNAIRTELQTIDIAKRLPDDNDYQKRLVESLSNLADYYYLIGDYSKAVQIGLQVMEYRSTDSEKYALSLNNLATYYAGLGDFSKAFEYGNSALEIRKSLYGEINYDYAVSLSNIAGYFACIGDYAKAVELGEQAADILRSTIGEDIKDSANYASALANIANYYSELGNRNKAVELGTQAISIRKSLYGEGHPEYAKSLANLADYYFELENYTKAIELGNKALAILKESLGDSGPDYANYLNSFSVNYARIGDYSKALEFEKKAMEIFYTSLGNHHPRYATSLSNLAGYYLEIGDFSNALHYSNKSLSIIKSNTFEQFSGLTSKQRIMLWNSHSNLFFNIYPSLTYKSKATTAPDLYDKSALFAKELLLSTEIEMNRLIQESGDKEALRMFEELQLNRLQLQKLYEIPIAQRQVNTDSLAQVIEGQERSLVIRSKEYGDFTRKLRTTWQDVQEALKSGEIAIEFLSFHVYGSDSIMVAALTLRKDDKEPKFIPLFEQRQLNNLPDTFLYHCPELTALVWQPLKEELRDISRVYFSPAGVLHGIGIEYAPGMEDYELLRLSTTREVIDMKKTKEGNPSTQAAYLYGGIDYDTSLQTSPQIESSGTSIQRDISIRYHHAFIDSLRLRSVSVGFDGLPGTKKEVEAIKRLLDDKSLSSTLRTGAEATETSVKDIDGQAPRILHIATHGFFFSENQVRSLDMLRFISKDESQSWADLEDKALTRSGLLMAGANGVLLGEDLPMEMDDGILTAQEISRLDLRGLDLVVLSACKTGNGEVSGDGVFGLQRAFKKAGAQTIVMSLSEVQDEATQILMTSFYDNLLQGLSKREAFHRAQRYLCSVENGKYDHPKYWAVFVLID